DLWAFNEEVVVRAIGASSIPIIAAVGHEIDWTLTDFVADVRAATPSNAAELAVPDQAAIAQEIAHLGARAERAIRRRLEDRRQRLIHVTEKYGFERLHQLFERWHVTVTDAALRMRRALGEGLARRRQHVTHLAASYALR